MPHGTFIRPDVLVLGAGGILGEAWMTGVLAGIEQAAGVDLRECEHFVGTSAGSIVAAALVAGRSPRAPDGAIPEMPARADDEDERSGLAAALLAAAGLGLGLAAPLAPLAIRATAPSGARLRAAVLARAEGTRDDLEHLAAEVERSGARFDGRLRVVCVERASGRRVVFGSPGAPRATVAQAVQASCAIPGVFRPVRIGGEEYVDGGTWSVTSLDIAPAGRGSRVLCLAPTTALQAGASGPVAAIGALAQAATAVEALALRNRGAVVRTLGPDRDAAEVIGPNLMDPRRRAEAAAAGYRQGVALADDWR